ncbi:MAG TPA: DUF3800 domain-containing protein [Candidatus Dormibacteraeota bacterium]|nr:DUF3800 domain-containing protein [Candidatus Dormibacteraeota bacterium]
MFTAYFDDSGTDENSKIAVAACYIGTVEQWDRLARAWDSIRREEHAAFEYFATADCLAGAGQFAGWTWEKRDRLIRRLIAETRNRVRLGIGTAVIKADYDATLPGGWRRRVAGQTHFAFAVNICLMQIKRWRRRFKVSEPIQYVFDLTGKGKGEILATLAEFERFDPNSFGIVKDGYSFKSKKTLPPLQAVDILAHQSYQHMRDCIVGKKKTCKDYMPFLSKVPLETQYFDKEYMDEFFPTYPWEEIKKKFPKHCID